MPSHTEIGEFIWRIADHLRGDYEKNDNEDVILPFTLLRRLDCVLEETRDKVRETEAQLADKVTKDVLKKLLVGAAGVPFYNRSKFSFTELLKDAANIKQNFGTYLEGFSDNIKEILYNFSGGEEKGLAPIYETLARKNLLYLITKEFASERLNLHPDVVSNHDMGLVYEYLIRKFKEGAAAGEQYPPRDVVQLLVQLVFADVEGALKKSKGTLVAICDPAVGTGGMVTVAKEYLTNQWGLDPSNVFIYGQELREKTYAICKADALMKGDDGSRIKQGNTLSEDQLVGHQFNFMMANPEFGTDWKKIEDVIRREAERGTDGRFGAGLPDVGDASFLFLQHIVLNPGSIELENTSGDGHKHGGQQEKEKLELVVKELNERFHFDFEDRDKVMSIVIPKLSTDQGLVAAFQTDNLPALQKQKFAESLENAFISSASDFYGVLNRMSAEPDFKRLLTEFALQEFKKGLQQGGPSFG